MGSFRFVFTPTSGPDVGLPIAQTLSCTSSRKSRPRTIKYNILSSFSPGPHLSLFATFSFSSQSPAYSQINRSANHHTMPAAEGGPQTLYDKVFQDHIVDERLDGTILLYIGECTLR